MKTKVISMLGGPGSGKSSIAAGLFFHLKAKRKKAELVTEYVKDMVWRGQSPGKFDQPLIFGEQLKREAVLYNKVQYIVTDSPLLLSPMYEMYLNDGQSLIFNSCLSFLDRAKNNDVEHMYFMLERTKEYDPSGRYQTEDEAKYLDVFIRNEVDKLGIKYEYIVGDDHQKVASILYHLFRMEGQP